MVIERINDPDTRGLIFRLPGVQLAWEAEPAAGEACWGFQLGGEERAAALTLWLQDPRRALQLPHVQLDIDWVRPILTVDIWEPQDLPTGEMRPRKRVSVTRWRDPGDTRRVSGKARAQSGPGAVG